MKKTLLFLAAILISLSAAAAYSAGQVLAKTSQKFTSAKGLSAQFIAKSEGVTSSGILTMAKERFAMNSTDFGVWYNGEVMWSYYKENNEVNLTSPTIDELMECNPFYIINQYSEHFNAALEAAPSDQYCVALTPKAKGQSVKRAVLTINAKTWLPTSIEATFANGSVVKIDIAKVVESQTAPGTSTFEFPYSEYPKAEVIDLR